MTEKETLNVDNIFSVHKPMFLDDSSKMDNRIIL